MEHDYHFSVRRWIFWTFVAGVLIGIYVLANLAAWEHTTPIHLRVALALGAVFWALFAFVAWTADGIEVQERKIFAARPVSSPPSHEAWEDSARAEAIRSRAVEHTGESHLAS